MIDLHETHDGRKFLAHHRCAKKHIRHRFLTKNAATIERVHGFPPDDNGKCWRTIEEASIEMAFCVRCESYILNYVCNDPRGKRGV